MNENWQGSDRGGGGLQSGTKNLAKFASPLAGQEKSAVSKQMSSYTIKGCNLPRLVLAEDMNSR